MGYVDERPLDQFPMYRREDPRSQFPKTLRGKLKEYASLANYNDHVHFTRILESVYTNFQPLPEKGLENTHDETVETQLPGYTNEGAIAKEIYWKLFGKPPPLPAGKPTSPAEEAGQVYLRDPWTFIRDFRPQISPPANPATLDLLRQQIPKLMEPKIYEALSERENWTVSMVEETTKTLIDSVPTEYLDVLSISNGIHGVGWTDNAILSPAEDILADPGEVKTLQEDAKREDSGWNEAIAGFRIASSPPSSHSSSPLMSTWYVVQHGNRWIDGAIKETYFWSLIYVSPPHYRPVYNWDQLIGICIDRMRGKIEYHYGHKRGRFYRTEAYWRRSPIRRTRGRGRRP